MFSIKNFDYDCTIKCKFLEHGDKISSALTKRGISNDKLAAYVAKVCKNFMQIKDTLGRSALHVASSVDKYTLVEWLLNHGALINAKDVESGSSSLHRAIFYGCIDCAELLLRYGASLETVDSDTRSPLQHVCKLSDIHQNFTKYNELLVWGSNKNYNLGIGNDQAASSPQFVHVFRKNNTIIDNLAIGPFHSLFLDKKGILYSVGHGKGGRLGIGSENSLAIPKKIKLHLKNLNEKIIQISVATNHSMVLTNVSSVFVCGSNEYQQIGMKPPPECLLSFKEIPTFIQLGIRDICGIVAKDFHSIAYSKNELYVWGQNNGQFGLNNSSAFITLPKKITMPDNSKIKFVESSNYGIAVSTTTKLIFLYYNFKVKSIKPPLLEDVKAISMTTNDQLKSTKSPPFKLLLLTDTNVLYILHDDMQQYLRCSFGRLRLHEIDRVIFRKNQILMLSQGDVFSAKCTIVPVSHIVQDSSNAWLTRNSSKNDICTVQKIRIDLKHIANIDRAVEIFADDDFESFSVLQEHSRKYFVIPQLPLEEYNFEKLYSQVSEFDGVHDIIFHVDSEIFYAHKFIVFCRSKGLKIIVEKFQNNAIYLNFINLTGKMFELILKHIYTNYFLTNDDIDDIQKSLGSNFKGVKNDVLAIYINFLEKFDLTGLVEYIQCVFCLSKPFDKFKHKFNRLKRSTLPDLYDVIIECANNQEIKAHKCVLVTRLEYFNLMFTNNWSETSKISLTTIPIEYIEPMIDFLYNADVERFRKQNYTQSFLYNMTVFCDQFFINRLRKVCEVLLLEKISVRKCGEMLEFGCSYNCELLKSGCLNFICQNLSRVLLQRSLENCDSAALNLINSTYRQIFKNIFDYRTITPDGDAVKDDVLLNFINDFAVDLDFKMEEENSNTKNKLKFKESKYKLSRRQYEQEAISLLKESGNIVDKPIQTNVKLEKTAEIFKEVAELNETITCQSKLWTTVADKKDVKKKFEFMNTALQANTILSNEKEQKYQSVNIHEVIKSTEKLNTSSFNAELNNDSISSYSLNIGDITPIKSCKLSQKDRKRRSSEVKVEQKSPKTTTIPSTPINISSKKTNAWGDITSPDDQKSSLADIMKSPDSNLLFSKKSLSPQLNLCISLEKSNSFLINLFSTSSLNSAGAVSKNSKTSSFSKIIEEEKIQKEYYEKLKTKSLVLTQIEETAIDELKKFYNVEHCEDEVINIERKSIPTTTNFAVWQRN